MEFTLLSSASLTFANAGKNLDGTMNVKLSRVQVDKLEGANLVGGGASFLTNLEGLLLAQPSREGKRQWFSHHIDSTLKVMIFYGALCPAAPKRKETGYFRIHDSVKDSHGLFKRLASVCGDYYNIQASVKLEFGTNNERMNLSFDFEDLMMSDEISFGKYFNLTEGLAQEWDTQANFTGTVSITLKVNDEALNLIHMDSVKVNDLVYRKLLEDAKESGDGIIVVENEKEIRCHKAILSAHSDVFKAMFNSDMKEGKSSSVKLQDISEAGVKALLGYLYCCDIQEALGSSLVAVELLRMADKYGINKLFEIMKDLILAKDDTWFSVEAAVQLLTLVRNRVDSVEFKELEEKAKLLLKSKPARELKDCAEFCELFENTDNAVDMWIDFMGNQ